MIRRILTLALCFLTLSTVYETVQAQSDPGREPITGFSPQAPADRLDDVNWSPLGIGTTGVVYA
ncbi:MAG: hypothetical protein PHR28_11410, partial [candidate division Zixibacteria bacterium]|nr:hypothetical protein [candidate division Zixibacteria bacterium]